MHNLIMCKIAYYNRVLPEVRKGYGEENGSLRVSTNQGAIELAGGNNC
ncbi:hypothetical protein GCM10020331_049500 [Ectobacillus funiculus]